MCRFKLAVVQHNANITWFKYIICVGSSCIITLATPGQELFKYIICVGSRFVGGLPEVAMLGLNTSYVSVQALRLHELRLTLRCLNTSYVSVQVRLFGRVPEKEKV